MHFSFSPPTQRLYGVRYDYPCSFTIITYNLYPAETASL